MFPLRYAPAAAIAGGGSEVLIVYGLDASPGTFFAGTAFEETSITLKACGGGRSNNDLSINNRNT